MSILGFLRTKALFSIWGLYHSLRNNITAKTESKSLRKAYEDANLLKIFHHLNIILWNIIENLFWTDTWIYTCVCWKLQYHEAIMPILPNLQEMKSDVRHAND